MSCSRVNLTFTLPVTGVSGVLGFTLIRCGGVGCRLGVRIKVMCQRGVIESRTSAGSSGFVLLFELL